MTGPTSPARLLFERVNRCMDANGAIQQRIVNVTPDKSAYRTLRIKFPISAFIRDLQHGISPTHSEGHELKSLLLRTEDDHSLVVRDSFSAQFGIAECKY